MLLLWSHYPLTLLQTNCPPCRPTKWTGTVLPLGVSTHQFLSWNVLSLDIPWRPWFPPPGSYWVLFSQGGLLWHTVLITVPHGVYCIIQSCSVHCSLPLRQRLTNCGLWVTAGLPPVFVKKVLMEHSDAHSFVLHLCTVCARILCTSGRTE